MVQVARAMVAAGEVGQLQVYNPPAAPATLSWSGLSKFKIKSAKSKVAIRKK